MSDAAVRLTGSATHAPAEVKRLAERLGKAHDTRVILSREASGYHIYLPCPKCLYTHGRNEVNDPKYAINASKYLGLGEEFSHLREEDIDPSNFNPSGIIRNEEGRQTRDSRSSVCMRTCQSKDPHRFDVEELLSMSTITQRHPDIHTKFNLVGGLGGAEKQASWETDPATGQKCPPPPGEVTPITELPPDHPAVVYLLQRQFDLQRLYDQFRCGFCTKEYPHGKNGIFYRRMPADWKDSPQNRIIFHSLHGGVPLSWQGRVLEKLSDDGLQKYMLHPYARTWRWDHVATRSSTAGSWIPVSPFDEVDEEGSLKFKPSKYRTAKYSDRELMGWDAAIARAQADEEDIKWCVLNEGPLDAARWGPGGLALMGKSISAVNAIKVAQTFNIVFTAFDNDSSGREATEGVAKTLMECKARAPILAHVEPLRIPGGKDPGDLPQEVADQILASAIRRSKRAI